MAINMKPFWDGVTDGIVTSTPNPDEGRKKYHLIEGFLVNIFTKIVGTDVVVEAYSKNDPRLLMAALKTYDIDSATFGEFVRLIGEAKNPNTRERDSFSDAQYLLLEMFRKKVEHQFSTGELNIRSVEPSIIGFSGLLAGGKKSLLSLFPHDQVSHLYLNKDSLESAIAANVEMALNQCNSVAEKNDVRDGYIVPYGSYSPSNNGRRI